MMRKQNYFCTPCRFENKGLDLKLHKRFLQLSSAFQKARLIDWVVQDGLRQTVATLSFCTNTILTVWYTWLSDISHLLNSKCGNLACLKTVARGVMWQMVRLIFPQNRWRTAYASQRSRFSSFASSGLEIFSFFIQHSVR